MNSTQATKLQEQITKEALALLSIGGTEIDVSQHEQVIRLTGTAWRLSSEDTDAMLDLIQQEKMVMQKLEAGEQATHIALNDEELLINWSGMETLETVEDLFETSLRLESYPNREAMFKMAMTLIESQNLLDWIEKTPAEKARLKLATM